MESSQKLNWKNITIFTIMIIAAISFAISGSFVVKNGEETQIILEDNPLDIVNPVSVKNYSVEANQHFQYHEIHVKQKEETGANNTWIPGDYYSGIYIQVYDGDFQLIAPNSSQNMLSYHCDTRNFSIIVTQMSQFLYSYEIELYTFYQDTSANLWYLFGGFLGIWAVCIILLFIFKRKRDQVRAK